MLIDNKQYKAELVGQYRQIKDELSTTNDGLVLRDDRICIPEVLQNRIVQIAHQGHLGIVKTKQLVRHHVWFPNIDARVEKAIKACRKCQVNTDSSHIERLLIRQLKSNRMR